MIDDIRRTTGHGIRPICEALEVPRSSYYHAAEPTATECSDREIGEQIEAIFRRHRRRYGHRRIWRELADQGIACAPSRVRTFLRDRQFGSPALELGKATCKACIGSLPVRVLRVPSHATSAATARRAALRVRRRAGGDSLALLPVIRDQRPPGPLERAGGVDFVAHFSVRRARKVSHD